MHVCPVPVQTPVHAADCDSPARVEGGCAAAQNCGLSQASHGPFLQDCPGKNRKVIS